MTMKKIILLFAGLAFLSFKNQAQTVTDYDGNVYNIITIGTQEWIKENLEVSHYSNGAAIPLVTDSLIWGSLGSGAYCYYKNDPITYSSTYGKLYNYYTVIDSRNLCPVGWHVPSNDEWLTLATYLGGYSDPATGGKMKEIGTTHWAPPNDGATNTSNFTGLPGGFRRDNASFDWNGTYGFWWSTTIICDPNAWSLRYMDATIANYGLPGKSGYSVRCIRDSTAQINEINYQDEIKIYPNPSIDRITIDCANKQPIKMQVYNMVGECVLQREFSNCTNEINVSSLSKGIYEIKLTGADWTVQRKLIKE